MEKEDVEDNTKDESRIENTERLKEILQELYNKLGPLIPVEQIEQEASKIDMNNEDVYLALYDLIDDKEISIHRKNYVRLNIDL